MFFSPYQCQVTQKVTCSKPFKVNALSFQSNMFYVKSLFKQVCGGGNPCLSKHLSQQLCINDITLKKTLAIVDLVFFLFFFNFFIIMGVLPPQEAHTT